MQAFDLSNIEYYTYADPFAKKVSVIIRNIHPSIDVADILNELKEQFKVNKVTRLHNKDGSPIPIVAVELNSPEVIPEIL